MERLWAVKANLLGRVFHYPITVGLPVSEDGTSCVDEVVRGYRPATLMYGWLLLSLTPLFFLYKSPSPLLFPTFGSSPKEPLISPINPPVLFPTSQKGSCEPPVPLSPLDFCSFVRARGASWHVTAHVVTGKKIEMVKYIRVSWVFLVCSWLLF